MDINKNETLRAISTINNKKRQINDFNITNKNSKKRKLNNNDISDKLHQLFQSNKLLKEQNSNLINERDHYKYGCNLYKKEYMKLHSLMGQMQNHGQKTNVNNDINTNNTECEINQNEPNQSALTQIETSDEIPQLSDNNSKLEAISDDNDNMSLPLIPELECNNSDNANSNSNSNYVEFENSYDVSINCHICEQHFIDILKHRKHIKDHYTNEQSRKWLYCKCNPKKNWDNATKFVRHIQTHTNTKPFVCSVIVNGVECGIAYRHKVTIKNHWKRHFEQQSEQSQQTAQIDKSIVRNKRVDAKRNRQKKAHATNNIRRTRNKERIFQCPQNGCDKSFYQRSDLRRHGRVHLGLKPFQCSICNQKFTQRGSIYRHISRAHKGKDPKTSYILLTQQTLSSRQKTHVQRRTTIDKYSDSSSESDLETPYSPSNSDHYSTFDSDDKEMENLESYHRHQAQVSTKK